MLVSLQELINNNIIHNNIDFENILINKQKDIPLIASFSFSINILLNVLQPFLRKIFIAFEPTYCQWPLEIHILCYLNTNKKESISNTNLENIIHDVINSNYILNTFGESFVSEYREDAFKYFSKYVNKNYDFIVFDILKFSHTWDNYALSLLFLKIMIYLHRCCIKPNKFIIHFMKLLVRNISINPEKRLSIIETTNKFEIILDNIDISDFHELFKNLVFS